MDNFSYYNPVRIYFGAGQVARIADEITQDKRVMVIYGQGSVKSNGILNQVKTTLKNSTIYEFGGIEPNPHYETLLHAIDIVRTENIDYLLAVGGGSVIDGTKFIAAAAKYDGDIWDIIESRGEVVEDAIQLGCVLTLAATGSEMNGGASIMRASTHDKLFFRSAHVLPQFSVLDPETTYTLPLRQTANGVVDAFVHVLEQYITWPVNASVQDRMAEGLLNTLKEEGPKVLSMPGDYDARANIMWSATIALNGLLRTGVPEDWSSHMIGMELTGLYGLDHARTLAILIPAVWNYKINEKSEKLAQYAARVWGIPQSNRLDMAQQAIQCTIRFFELMGMKTHFSDYGLGAEIIPEVVKKLCEHGHTALGEYNDITPENVESILRIAL
ncbi:iron-containing alcohol dehydrogenase [Salmonella enterica]|nr:iron-containing alcohol dehydrogenase [Salmonella enterica]MJF13712.1 NADH-dependent alcohol dehydrogenase [Salmonella enterica subsp. enterica]HEC7292089.1 iron-containing alcohol dehydrogenase [Salmonella enterica subsp. enterica serovar Pensacola]EDS9872753.1 iron-containing alcohol dehydrogenase [Salmonella enterica]EHY2509742.1 iron-containing alcohol dehydrogenase [Salmonella enterica]